MKILGSLKYDKPCKDKSCDWKTARKALGLSEAEWEEQIGGLGDAVTNIICFLSAKDRMRRALGMKPNDKIPTIVR